MEEIPSKHPMKKEPSQSKSENDINENQFYLFYNNLLIQYSKHHYRKLLKTIEQNSSYESSPFYWKITHLKIKCLQQLLERKLIKYVDNPIIPSFTVWLKRYDQEILIWLTNLAIYNPGIDIYYYDKLELLISFTLNQCFNYSLFCIKQSNICDCLGFLALGERLIKNVNDFILHPDSMFYASQIMLLLSSFYITDNNIESAKNYIIAVLKFSYKELELRIKIDIKYLIVLDDTYTKDEKESIYNVFLNITIAFFHLGVCYEYENEIEKSYQAYQQAKWFGKNIKMNKITAFTNILYDIEERSNIRKEIINFFNKEENNINEKPPCKKKKQIYVFNEERKEQKYAKIQTFLEKLKIPEVDDDDKELLNKVNEKPFSTNVNNLTKTIHVLNYLMSNQFKKVINNMNNIEINKLNKDTKRFIQKRITHLKNIKRLKLIKQYDKEQDNKTNQNKDIYPQIINDNAILNKNNSNYVGSSTNTKTIPSTLHTTSRNSTEKSIYHLTKTNSHSNNMKLLSTADGQNKKYKLKASQTLDFQSHDKKYKKAKNMLSSQQTKKIIYSPYVFNKAFQNKVQFLDKQYSRELQFQKKLLHCKEEEKVTPFEHVNERKINHQCDNFFESTLKNELQSIKEKEINLRNTELAKKSSAVSQNIRKAFSTTSVNNKKSVNKYDKIKYESIEYTLKMNQNSLNMLQQDLDSLENIEKGLINKLKMIRKKKKNRKGRLIKKPSFELENSNDK